MAESLEVYAARHKNKDVLKRSSSGGVFTALTDVCLNAGNAIACAVYNYDQHEVQFSIVTNADERDKAVGSMYVQANMGTIYKDSERWLKEHPDRLLMFVGLGCQVVAFKRYIEIKHL